VGGVNGIDDSQQDSALLTEQNYKLMPAASSAQHVVDVYLLRVATSSTDFYWPQNPKLSPTKLTPATRRRATVSLRRRGAV